MLSPTEFNVDARDIRFVLHEQIGLENLLKLEPYTGFTVEDCNLILEEAIKQAKEVYAPANRPGDRKGCRRNPDGSVTLPEETVGALRAYREAGWTGITNDLAWGGQGLPMVIGAAAGEVISGANMAMMMYPALTRSAAHLIENFCAEDLKRKFVRKLYGFEYQGTMCLTEPTVGTAVGDLKTTARPNGDHYLIEGQKIFISCAENPIAENVVHLVLARAAGSPPGIKGISLFVVPKFLVNDDGSLGARNDLICSGIEHKMGINASATCQMSFGDNGRCVGYLVGEVNQGIVYMFQMMNEARIGVGLQGVCVANAAYLNALAYAQQRVQGVSAENFKDPSAPRIAIVNHPDVSRMLLWQKAFAEGGRSMLYSLASWADRAEHSPDEAERRRFRNLLDLCTPILKAYYTDRGFESAVLAIQCYGGYGYIQDYPVEQYARDAKISSLYEGTNGVQALDLLGRKIALQGGMLFMQALGLFNDFAAANADHPHIGPLLPRLTKAKDRLAQLTMAFGQMSMTGNMAYPVSHATAYLKMFGHLFHAYFLLDQARIAGPKLEAILAGAGATDEAARRRATAADAEAKFYHGKLQAARFFVTQVLPELDSLADSADSQDRSVLDMVW